MNFTIFLNFGVCMYVCMFYLNVNYTKYFTSCSTLSFLIFRALVYVQLVFKIIFSGMQILIFFYLSYSNNIAISIQIVNKNIKIYAFNIY